MLKKRHISTDNFFKIYFRRNFVQQIIYETRPPFKLATLLICGKKIGFRTCIYEHSVSVVRDMA